MAFTVEDGTGLSDSNAYLSVAAFKAYCDDRGKSYSGFSDTQIQQAIVRSSDYADIRWRYKGIRLSTGQAMEFPRIDAAYDDGEPILGVPDEMVQAVAEYSLLELNGTTLAPNPAYDTTNFDLQSIAQQVGDVSESKTFASSSGRRSFRDYPSADRKLRELVVDGTTLQRV
jgi:hypothetical protein